MRAAVQRSVASAAKSNSPFFSKDSERSFFTASSTENSFFRSPATSSPAIQARLSVGKPGDKFEQEADAIATEVVNKSSLPGQETKPSSKIQPRKIDNAPSTFLQAKCAECEAEDKLNKKEEKEEEENNLQRKAASDEGTSEPLTVQARCTQCEEEELLQGKEEKDKDDQDLQRKPDFENNVSPTGVAMLQSKCAACEEEEMLQGKAENEEEETGLQRKQGLSELPAVQAKCEQCEEEEKIQEKASIEVDKAEVQSNPMPGMGNNSGEAIVIQPKCAACEEEEKIQEKEEPISEDSGLQKIPIHDPIENAAENMAVQAKCEACEQEEKKENEEKDEEKIALQRKPVYENNFRDNNGNVSLLPFTQAKLTVGHPGDKYEKEADAIADRTIQRISDQTVTNHSAGDNIQEKEEAGIKAEPMPEILQMYIQRWCRECEEGDIVWDGMVQRAQESNTPKADGSKESIVAAARSQIGKVEGKNDDGSGKRKGADRLLEYFNIAAPGVWPDNIIETAGVKMPSWCGIFSVWAHKKAGKDIGTWQMGKGVSAFNTITQTTDPQPGDIGYIDRPYQHHCIIERIEGDTVYSIDGNSGLFSEVKENRRTKKDYDGFFTAFGGGSSNVQKKEEDLQARDETGQPGLSSSLENKLNGSKGHGDALPDPLRNQMESAIGADFSQVKIHTDSQAVSMSKDLHAQAFTHGSDIYFNSGKYDTASKTGQHLLSHELTHTVQQGASRRSAPAAETSINKTPEDTLLSRSGENVIMRAYLVDSTMKICHRVLKSRTFTSNNGSVAVKVKPRLSDPGNPTCKHHTFYISLTFSVGPIKLESRAIKFDSSKPDWRGWIGVPDGECYLTIWREYDNPNCCLEGEIVVTDTHIVDCEEMRANKEFPSQHGGVWNENSTGKDGGFGPGPKLDGPYPSNVYLRDPGIPSGSTCRGACGPNCDTCEETPEYIYFDPVSGETWRYTNFQDCNVHTGCKEHDAAFDWAAAVKGEVGPYANYMKWHMAANKECICNFNVGQCYGWIKGRPPHEGKLYFADKAEKIEDGYLQSACKEANPDFIDCTDEGADMDEVLVLWGLENGYKNFRNFKPFQDFPAGEIRACDLGPGRTWHGLATDTDTGKDVIISIFDCYCCNEEGESGSDFRSPHVSDINATLLEILLEDLPSKEVPMIKQGTYTEAQNLIQSKEKKKFQMALDVVMIDLIASGTVDTSLFNIKFNEASDQGEGLTTTQYTLDPASGNYIPNGPAEVTLYVTAFSSVQFMVSILMHEYQHVVQQQRPRPKHELIPEAQGGRRGEFSAANEVQSYLWQLENAEPTGINEHPGTIRELFERLTYHYDLLGTFNKTHQATYTPRYEAIKKTMKPKTREEEELEKCDNGKLPPDHCKKLYDRVKKRFGKGQDFSVDPDTKDNSKRVRVDDAPVMNEFRLVYNRLDSWDIYIRRTHPGLYDEFTKEFELNLKRNTWLDELKKENKDYKSDFRNLPNYDVEATRDKYRRETLARIKNEINTLNFKIADWYILKTGSKDSPADVIERIHVEGTALWRQEWENLVLAVNRVLSSLWPPAKGKIIKWVDDQKKAFPHIDFRGTVKDIDYVGSLATGIKGAPKQFIRFNVNKFDVDANLDAPPLATYAIKVDNIKPDRKRIFAIAQGTSITPLLNFCFDAHRSLSTIKGYEVTEQFDVVINAPELPEQRDSRTGTERIYKLREHPCFSEDNYRRMIEEIHTANLMVLKDGILTLKPELTKDEAEILDKILKKYEALTVCV